MSRRGWVIAGAIGLVVVAGIGLWFATMPYPVRIWWHACLDLRYSDQWPISELDYAMAMSLVTRELEWREIITKVNVIGPDEMEIRTMSEFRHSLDVSGRFFIVKKVDGQWAVGRRGLWMS